jgi:HSP20 family molecular chaperone IbpA
VPEGLKVLHAEMREPHYRRVFTLSPELDASRIDANLKDGVLTLRLPRTEQAKPRRIDVTVN